MRLMKNIFQGPTGTSNFFRIFFKDQQGRGRLKEYFSRAIKDVDFLKIDFFGGP